jgi:hypothetical protein
MQHYKIVVGDQSRVVQATSDTDSSNVMAIVDEMVKAAGGGVPNITKCDADGNPEKFDVEAAKAYVESVELPPPPASGEVEVTPKFSDWGNTVVDKAAKARIEDLHKKIGTGPNAINIDTSQQYFETGTRMAAEGYATQKKRQKEHDKLDLLKEVISEFQDKVSNEIRRDLHVSAKEIANEISVEDNKLYVKDHLLTERAIRGIFARLDSPALGYILGLQERIASETINTNADHIFLEKDVQKLADTLHHECKRFGDVDFKLRTREFPRDIYAALSPTYGVADAPMVMEEILDQMPKEARGSYAYDPETTSWELRASIWTPVPVDEQAVGEPFEGYVSLSSRDNGTGRFNGGGGINILRCLNASTYTAGEALTRIHRGKVMYDINGMVTKSLKAIHTLCEAWGIARKEKIELPQATAKGQRGPTLEEAIPGFWRSLLKEGELSKVLVGRKENHVKALTKTYFDERRDKDNIVRADFAQGWTRYIQDQPPAIRRDAEQAIGAWVVNPGKQPMKCELKERD